jgi:hypothetical protein
MFDLLLFQKAILNTGLRKAVDFLPMLRAEDPQIIKKKYNIDIIAKIKAKNPVPPSYESKDRTKFCIVNNEALKVYARWYKYRAQMLWGRETQRDRFRSAWFYVTSAELYELADDPQEASNQYHFAANTFRELEAFRASIDYYVKSSELGSGQWVLRCLQRALGVARNAGDEEQEEEVQSRLTAWRQTNKKNT